MIRNLHIDESGSSAVVELVLGAPLLAVLIWLIVWAGTGGQTPGEVSLAAHDGARLASTVRNPAERPAAVDALVRTRLGAAACKSWRVTTTSTDAVVTVGIDCELATAQMAGLGLGGRTVTVTGRSTIDPFFIQGRDP